MTDDLDPFEVLRVTGRVKGKTWRIYVCAEPDGENCEKGTHPNILTHHCAAIKRFHEGGEGPRVLTVEVAPVPRS
jgi:hypothetical protein